MSEIIIQTQKELDALDKNVSGTIYIEGGTEKKPLVLKINFESAIVICRGSAQIIMRESSQVHQMWGEAMVSCYGLQKIVCAGYNVVRTRNANRGDLTVVLNDTSHLIVIPDPDTTFEDYKRRYPVIVDGEYAKVYKAVHKVDGEYQSNHNSNFRYEIGKVFTEQCNPSLEESCAAGLHVSHLTWALEFGKSWNDMAILECKVPVDKILVSKDCDGKVRTSELEVVRELDKSEYQNY